MTVQNYDDLNKHRGHNVSVQGYYTENVAIECTDCFEVLLDFDNEKENNNE